MNRFLLNAAIFLILVLFSAACLPPMPVGPAGRVIPAEEFSQALNHGEMDDFSVSRLPYKTGYPEKSPAAMSQDRVYGDRPQPTKKLSSARAQLRGDPRFLNQGLELKKSIEVPSPQIKNDEGAALFKTATFAGQFPHPPTHRSPAPVPGSSAPYHMGQMTANPSLWPDEAQGALLFTDHRAFQPMDIITIVINENTRGNKKAETDAESKFDILAGITEFFGIETRKWAANNESLDPSKLIQAQTDVKFEGEGETKRSGTLTAHMSAVIMEVFPNGLMRIEGTKIVSIDNEEEVIVISGLVRQRDITGENQVSSNRIANMRIDFYGQGLIAEHQRPGWAARIFEIVWPF